MISAEGPNAAQVDRFSLRTNAGQVILFVVGRLDQSNDGLPAPHLREHLVSGIPITVFYNAEQGNNVAVRYIDVAPTSSSTTTLTPTATTQASPITQPTSTTDSGPTPPRVLQLVASPFASGFGALTLVSNAGDGSGILYAVQQQGFILPVSTDGTVSQTAFLSIDDRIKSGGEQGLLGLAFHPDYATNGRFFVDYTDLSGDTVLSEFERSSDASADPASERVLLTIDQPFANHNGGMIAFGADGYLYIGMGDGGSFGDPFGSGQNLMTLLGKILRINVDSGDAYGIPANNPFPPGNRAGIVPEIWDWGLRNPWRFSFDRETGALFIGDVGQGRREEIDAENAGIGGRNYGWNVMEGTGCYAQATCGQTGLTPPVFDYGRDAGECAVTGGYVYRGAQIPSLVGTYLFSDYCTGTLWGLDAEAALSTGSAAAVQLGTTDLSPSAFGEDESGELYIVDYSAGAIYRIVEHAGG